MRLDDVVRDLAPLFKERGYVKSRMTWRKPVGDVTLFFSIQLSHYGKDVWYYYFGVAINAILRDRIARSLSDCQLWERLDGASTEHIWTVKELIYLSERWEVHYGSVNKLHIKALEGKLPKFAKPEVIKYLSEWY